MANAASPGTTASTTGANTDKSVSGAIFDRPIQPDKYAPTIPPEHLDEALIVKYEGEQTIEFTKDGETRRVKKHVFQSRGGEGAYFSVFGSPNLNSQLRKVRQGATLLIRYRGKEPDELGRDVHVWDVTGTTATTDHVRQLRATGPWVTRETLFELARQSAASAEKDRLASRRAGQPPEPPPHTDDDLPF